MNTPPPDYDGTNEEAPGPPPDLPPHRDGRDEMNLSEYPIALLADRAPKDVKTLIYKDRDETLTITGSDYLGLPTALDVDVIIGLLYLTKQKNDFTDRTLGFTRYELLQVLRWSHRGRHYERITESLNRWVGVTLIYKKSWWDNDRRSKGNASFHIIDAANIVERGDSTSPQQQLPLSTIRWGEEFFRSCQANNLKRLDLEVYFSLGSSITKQLYRFLDKRFYKKPLWTFDLRTLACEHVGLSRNYPSWKLKQKLDPAIEELTAAGFLPSEVDPIV
jgi:plasmid replication initiation protein